MSPAIEPLDRASARGLAAELVERLTELIRTGALLPGDKMPTESTLTSDYGVSRTVVREALSNLQSAGLVETHQGRGSFVLMRPHSGTFKVEGTLLRTPEDADQMFEFRLGIECEGASLAASKSTPQQREAIHAELQRFANAGKSPSDAIEADFRFHLAVAKASNNRHFRELIGSLGPGMIAMPRERLSQSEAGATSSHLKVVLTEHQNILDAIERRDPEAARAAVRLHLSNSRARLRQSRTGQNELKNDAGPHLS